MDLGVSPNQFQSTRTCHPANRSGARCSRSTTTRHRGCIAPTGSTWSPALVPLSTIMPDDLPFGNACPDFPSLASPTGADASRRMVTSAHWMGSTVVHHVESIVAASISSSLLAAWRMNDSGSRTECSSR